MSGQLRTVIHPNATMYREWAQVPISRVREHWSPPPPTAQHGRPQTGGLTPWYLGGLSDSLPQAVWGTWPTPAWCLKRKSLPVPVSRAFLRFGARSVCSGEFWRLFPFVRALALHCPKWAPLPKWHCHCPKWAELPKWLWLCGGCVRGSGGALN